MRLVRQEVRKKRGELREVTWDTTNEIQVAKSGTEERARGRTREGEGVRIFSEFECEIISRTS